MKRDRAVRILSPTLVLLIALALLLMPRAPIIEDVGLNGHMPFGAAVAWADSTDPAQGGGGYEPSTEPDYPHP